MSADTPANTPPPLRPGNWLLASVHLADGRVIELQIPAAVSASAHACDAPGDGLPSLTLVVDGQRRRGRLGELFSDLGRSAIPRAKIRWRSCGPERRDLVGTHEGWSVNVTFDSDLKGYVVSFEGQERGRFAGSGTPEQNLGRARRFAEAHLLEWIKSEGSDGG